MTLNELLERATPRPWDSEWADLDFMLRPDRRLVAHAVNVLPELVAKLEEARDFIMRFDEADECEIAMSGEISDLLDRVCNINEGEQQ